jgi:hypothetical protein
MKPSFLMTLKTLSIAALKSPMKPNFLMTLKTQSLATYLVKSHEAKLPDDSEGTDFSLPMNLPCHLESNLDDFQRIGKHDL